MYPSLTTRQADSSGKGASADRKLNFAEFAHFYKACALCCAVLASDAVQKLAMRQDLIDLMLEFSHGVLSTLRCRG